MKTKVLYFFAEWCYPSVAQIPNVVNVCKRYKIPFNLIDVETESGVNASIRMEVRNVPTIVITNNGKEIKRIKGNHGYKELDAGFKERR